LKPGDIPGEFHLWTGDQFRVDEEGYLYFLGRSDDIIKSRGEKVSPREIENAIYSLEGVKDVAVVGVPDDLLGEAVHAFVVLDEGTTYSVGDIVQHCTERLENFMVPTHVTFLPRIPKTSSGKIITRGIADLAKGATAAGG
jgi:acyl-coenzyme A synthetase/AMP-(fatty) acid ligase